MGKGTGVISLARLAAPRDDRRFLFLSLFFPTFSFPLFLRACAYIAFHLHAPLRLTVLAECVSRVSEGRLARLFREERGMSFTQGMEKGARNRILIPFLAGGCWPSF